MKNFLIFLLVALLLGSQSLVGQEIDHEKVEADGYSVITKGAYWSKRPEAKLVYEGQTPEGIDEVIILPSDHFVRFVKGEHNRYDINYIVFPKGEKIYRKGNEYFASICGNKIKTWRPVEKIVEKIVEVPVEKEQKSLSSNDAKKRPLDFGGETKAEKTPVLNPSVAALGKKQKKDKSDKTWAGRNLGWIIPTGSTVVGIVGGFVFPSEGYTWYHLFPTGVPHGTMSGGREATTQTGTTTTQTGIGRGE